MAYNYLKSTWQCRYLLLNIIVGSIIGGILGGLVALTLGR